jgi:hypothetical protein
VKIYLYPADEQGCGLHRIIWPALTLKGRGHDVTIVGPKARSQFLQGHLDEDKKLIDITVPSDADVIVLQRITHRHLVDAIPIIQRRGIAVVIDMDDDLSTIHPANQAFGMLHPKLGNHPDHSWHNAQRACDAATLVTVSTPSLLQRYARHGRGHVLYNCIPQRYLKMPHEDSAEIGWAGSLHSHPTDLHVVGSAVSQVCANTGLKFRSVGPGDGVRAALSLDHEPNATGPLEPMKEWPEGVTTIGVGIAPLADTIFNKSKSWLKPLEYAALGVPCVMSPSQEYTRLHQLGVGILAKKPRQWLRELTALTQSVDLRTELAGQGREVARTLTIEGNADLWLEAWKSAVELV